jgi:hypothetical protein
VRRWFDRNRAAAANLGYVPDSEKIAFPVPIYVADTGELMPALRPSGVAAERTTA